jgi:hypothetical protein
VSARNGTKGNSDDDGPAKSTQIRPRTKFVSTAKEISYLSSNTKFLAFIENLSEKITIDAIVRFWQSVPRSLRFM